MTKDAPSPDAGNDLLKTLAVTAGGLGFLRPAPGTWGSTPPCAVAWIIVLLGGTTIHVSIAAAIIAISATLICIALGAFAEQKFGRKDPSQVVIDEVAGQGVALLFIPAFAIETFWRATLTLGAAFILFRVFDILKPPPAYRMQRLKGGLGVVVDDLFAGLYAGIVLVAGLYALRGAGIL